jgi:hypothetical protein
MGMSFKAMYTQVGQMIQDSSADRLVRIKDAINRKYTELANGYDWPDLMRIEEAEVTVTAGEVHVYMPYHVQTLKGAVADGNKDWIGISDPGMFLARNFDQLATQAKIFEGTLIGSSPVKREMQVAETLTLVSSDASDTSVIVKVWGFVGGDEISESVTLNGTSSVATSNTFSRITRIGTTSTSRDSSRSGHITITGTTSSKELAVIANHNYDSRYQVFRFQDVSQAADTLSIFYKKRVTPLIDDDDTFEINDADLIVFELAMAEMLKSQAKYNQAGAHEARAAGIRSAMLGSYLQQSNMVQQSLPMGPGIDRFNHGSYLNKRISVQG